MFFLTDAYTSIKKRKHLNHERRKTKKMKNNTLKKVLLVFGAILLFSTSAFAQSQNRQQRKEPPTFEELIEAMDTNDDGKLSKNETKGRLNKDFEKIDMDEDGFITAEEFEKAPKPERGNRRQ